METLKLILEYLMILFGFVKKEEKPIDYVPTTPKPIQQPMSEQPIESEKTRLQRRCKLICIEEGLTNGQIKDMMATITAESNWNPKAIRENKSKGVVVSRDWGICQLNDYWYLRPLKLTSDQVVNDPELSMRIMAKVWATGKIIVDGQTLYFSKTDWIPYRTGKYKDFLNVV